MVGKQWSSCSEKNLKHSYFDHIHIRCGQKWLVLVLSFLLHRQLLTGLDTLLNLTNNSVIMIVADGQYLALVIVDFRHYTIH